MAGEPWCFSSWQTMVKRGGGCLSPSSRSAVEGMINLSNSKGGGWVGAVYCAVAGWWRGDDWGAAFVMLQSWCARRRPNSCVY